MVAGPSHVGKTWLMLDLAVSVAMGRDFLGKFPVQQGPVLTTDASASGAISTYSGSEQQAPASGRPSP